MWAWLHVEPVDVRVHSVRLRGVQSLLLISPRSKIAVMSPPPTSINKPTCSRPNMSTTNRLPDPNDTVIELSLPDTNASRTLPCEEETEANENLIHSVSSDGIFIHEYTKEDEYQHSEPETDSDDDDDSDTEMDETEEKGFFTWRLDDMYSSVFTDGTFVYAYIDGSNPQYAEAETGDDGEMDTKMEETQENGFFTWRADNTSSTVPSPRTFIHEYMNGEFEAHGPETGSGEESNMEMIETYIPYAIA
ncbi:hypothetical protein B0T10DRAFT_592203 [Thelonectria olida]|uniref:Uncharacterized protein n=1 Tax=Thelonectria olida TaxID=1576542 RepID=A0A9P9ARR9_9HYPO|nr:hypothetical protein B0T10DRAFT_592203 [Thelonectria olida]